MDDDWLTLTDAAAELGLADGAVIRNAIKRGRVPPDALRKIGPLWQIRRDTAEALWRKKDL